MVQAPGHCGSEAVRPGLKSPGAAGEGALDTDVSSGPLPFLHALLELSPEATEGLLLWESKKSTCQYPCGVMVQETIVHSSCYVSRYRRIYLNTREN